MKVICIGSGPNMTKINDWDTKGITIVGVNNTWKGTQKWDYLIHSGDYPFKKDIQKTRETQKTISREGDMGFRHSYTSMSMMEWEKARIFLGLPIYFTASYWCLHYLKPTHIGFLGFDMDYNPSENGSTAFYGVGYDMQKRGIPDPLYQFRTVKEYRDDPNIMHTLLKRLDERKGKTCFWNLSDSKNTALPWEKIEIGDFKSLK